MRESVKIEEDYESDTGELRHSGSNFRPTRAATTETKWCMIKFLQQPLDLLLHGSKPLAELSIRSFLICFKFPGQKAAGTYNAKHNAVFSVLLSVQLISSLNTSYVLSMVDLEHNSIVPALLPARAAR